MSYEDTIKGLSEGTAKVIAQLWAAVESARITVDDFRELAADLVAIARTRGALAAQAALRAVIEATYVQPVAAAAGASYADRDRLATAIGTVLASDLDTLMQLRRLAANEPLDAAATAYGDAMAHTPEVSGWRRGLEGDACQLCRWWWREGRVFHPTHRMPRHPGCACSPVPVIKERTTNYQTDKQAARAATDRRRK